jgi:hypothetical protein
MPICLCWWVNVGTEGTFTIRLANDEILLGLYATLRARVNLTIKVQEMNGRAFLNNFYA